MKLFGRRGNAAPANADATAPTALPAPPQPPPPPKVPEAPRQISLSAEQKSILEKPIDSRVDLILKEIYADKAAAESALNSRRIVNFPLSDSGHRHVIQDENGFWRIIPAPIHEEPISLLDAL
jgi:hypothetical protein